MRNAIVAIMLFSISACATKAQEAAPQPPAADLMLREEIDAPKQPKVEVEPEPAKDVRPLQLISRTEPEQQDESVEQLKSDLPIPQCIEPGEKNPKYSREERRETRERVQSVCRSVGASPIICAYMDAITVRESSGRAGVRHYKGHNENGLGAMGLSLRWHKDKWPGDDEDPQFCHPEVSAIVALDIMHRAMARYDASNIVELQSIYAGHWYCEGEGRNRKCHPKVRERDARVCTRMKARGHDCWKELEPKDLGRKIPMKDRRDFIKKLLSSFDSKKGPSS